MAHRRQYLPESWDRTKKNRRQLARENFALKNHILTERERAKEAAEEQRRAEEQKQNSGIRGLFNKARRVLTAPVFNRSGRKIA